MIKMENKSDRVYSVIQCEGFRKGSCLLYVPEEKNLYRFKTHWVNGKRYMCYNKSCKRSIVVEYANPSFCRVPKVRDVQHNHPTQEAIFEKMKLANSIKNRCAKSTLKRGGVREVFEEECSKNTAGIVDLEYKKMRRQLINIRKSSLPKCLENSTDVRNAFQKENVMQNFGMSRFKDSEIFYKGTTIEETFSYTVFMSPTINNEITKMSTPTPKTFTIDENVGIVADWGYKQLLIISFCYRDQIYPLLYVLMTSKSEECYRHLFMHIKFDLFKFEVDSFLLEFDNTIRSALKTVFPSATLYTSWFHFCRTIKRRANKIPSFASNVLLDSEVRNIFKKLLAIPLLKKPADIISGLELVRNEAISSTSSKVDQLFEELFPFFQRQWIKMDNSFFKDKNNIRTTIALDAFKCQLSRKLIKSCSFYKFMDFILDLDKVKSNEIVIIMNETFEPPKKRYKDRNNLIDEMTEKLDNKIITISHFLTNITNLSNKIPIVENLCRFDSIDDETKDVCADSLCVSCCKNTQSVLFEPFDQFKLCSTCFSQAAEEFIECHNSMFCSTCEQIGEKFHKNLYLSFIAFPAK